MSLPKWVNPLLQGLSYWIGYRKELYPHYKLSEGAIVAESQLLIITRLDTNQVLKCEVPYKTLNNKNHSQLRSDFVIYDGGKPQFVIEVKKHEAGIKKIIEDFQKLKNLKNDKKHIRCFLLIVSQNTFPKKFITPKGIARRKLDFEGFNLRIIRNCKSASSINENTFKKSNYCTLIEVLN
jgi:hypothetical protein